jgi:hypothetical protein
MNARIALATALLAVYSFAYVACRAQAPDESPSSTSIHQGARQ